MLGSKQQNQFNLNLSAESELLSMPVWTRISLGTGNSQDPGYTNALSETLSDITATRNIAAGTNVELAVHSNRQNESRRWQSDMTASAGKRVGERELPWAVRYDRERRQASWRSDIAARMKVELAVGTNRQNESRSEQSDVTASAGKPVGGQILLPE
ncbi:hypothetical protein B0H12DRAFT_1083269 [Mycena haematopus]|nr:hypothetical protein B0H12DRAFT_1083269 [Mycena haematopus]